MLYLLRMAAMRCRPGIRVTAIYVLVAGLWILLSDRLLTATMGPSVPPEQLSFLQSFKGLAYVFVTAALLNWLIERAWRRLQESEQQYRSLIELLPDVVLVNVNGTFQFINSAGLRFFGAESATDLLGKRIMDYIDPEFHEIVHQRIALMQQTGQPAKALEERWLRVDGSPVAAEVVASPLYWKGGRAVFVILRDLSQIKENARQLAHMATHDLLTGLPNLLFFRDRITLDLVRVRRVGRGAALLIIDVAKLRFINDSFGYRIGNGLLKQLASGLLAAIRPGDTVARLSGDQFAVFLADLDSKANTLTVISRIKASIARNYRIADCDLQIRVHCGVALCPEDAVGPEQLFNSALAAVHRSKTANGEEIEFYTPSISEETRQRFRMEQALTDAISNREFVLHYQPQISATDGKIVGCEALVRWQSPMLGMVPPDRFIPLAEETGQILAIGDWILREACRQIASWDSAGLGTIPTAVNLSARQLRQPGLDASVVEILRQNRISPQTLVLELTESTIMNDTDYTIDVIRRLRALGIQLSLDDFGTGYSSFSYLKTFSMDHLKIDKSFVHDLPNDEKSIRIIQSIIALGHLMEMRVVAEGVETAEQAAMLATLGCDILQGYFFSRPIDAVQFSELLKARAAFSWELAQTHHRVAR